MGANITIPLKHFGEYKIEADDDTIRQATKDILILGRYTSEVGQTIDFLCENVTPPTETRHRAVNVGVTIGQAIVGICPAGWYWKLTSTAAFCHIHSVELR